MFNLFWFVFQLGGHVRGKKKREEMQVQLQQMRKAGHK